MSSVMVQELAHSAASQGAHGVEGAASAGHGGRQPKNLHRDLMTLFGTPRGAPRFHGATHPAQFSCRACSCPNSSSTAFRCGKIASEDHQEQLVSSGSAHNTVPLSETILILPRARWAKTVPMGLHGDASPFTKQDGAFVISWNSLLGAAANKGFEQRRLFTVIRKNDLTNATLDALWDVFGWSTNVLLSGILPDRDWSGNEVSSGGRYEAEGWRGSLIQIRGDWEFLCSVFRFPYWNAASNMVLDVQVRRTRSSPLDSCWRKCVLACHQADARSSRGRAPRAAKASAPAVQRGHGFAVVRHGRRVALHGLGDHGARRG